MPERPKTQEQRRAAEHHFTVPRTARYYTLGTARKARAVWFVLHGYGQLGAYFVRHFAPVVEGGGFVVAPEALSRFYLSGPDHAAGGRVGATWMTRADRDHEMGDYVRYLDALYRRLRAGGLTGDVPVHLLGFSQGAATACRWAAWGDVRPRWLTLWAGPVPPDLNLSACHPCFSRATLTLVRGTEDAYITPERWAEQQARLDAHGLAYRTLAFDGGHRLDAETLGRLIGATTDG